MSTETTKSISETKINTTTLTPKMYNIFFIFSSILTHSLLILILFVVCLFSSPQGELTGYAILDLRGDNELNAILSIARTIFVSIVLSAGAILFSSDVENLVLRPIENMMQKVRRIADNPLEAA